MKKKMFIIFCVISLALVMLSSSAFAYTFYNGSKHPTTHIWYKIKANELKSTYWTPTNQAAESWEPNTPITLSGIYEYSYQMETNIDVYGGDYGNIGWNAYTTSYFEWIFWGNITDSYIKANYYSMDSMDATKKQGVLAHEFGHALGLDHVTNKYAIMCTTADGRLVNLPGPDDQAGIRALYQ